jgi:hypothetical protein
MSDVQAPSKVEKQSGNDSQWKILATLAVIAVGVGIFVVRGQTASACTDKDVQATVIKVLKDNHLKAMVQIPELMMTMGFVLMNDESTKTHVCSATANFKAEKLNGKLPIEFSAQPDLSGKSRYVVRVEW